MATGAVQLQIVARVIEVQEIEVQEVTNLQRELHQEVIATADLLEEAQVIEAQEAEAQEVVEVLEVLAAVHEAQEVTEVQVAQADLRLEEGLLVDEAADDETKSKFIYNT